MWPCIFFGVRAQRRRKRRRRWGGLALSFQHFVSSRDLGMLPSFQSSLHRFLHYPIICRALNSCMVVLVCSSCSVGLFCGEKAFACTACLKERRGFSSCSLFCFSGLCHYTVSLHVYLKSQHMQSGAGAAWQNAPSRSPWDSFIVKNVHLPF